MGTLVPAAVLFAARRPGWAVALAFVGVLLALFFRDPDRQAPVDPLAVVAPADGRVVHAGEVEPDAAPPGEWRQVSIFLSPLDVHVNRIPVSGRVTRVVYRPGRFLPAYRKAAATENERNELWIDHFGQTIVCRQVVGILARRIVCRIRVGAEVQAGHRFGIMKFGSRVDLFTPPTASLRVEVGEAVRGGQTVLAVLAETGGSREPGSGS